MRRITNTADSVKVLKTSVSSIIISLEKRMRLANRSEATIRNYSRSVRKLCFFHSRLPEDLEIDQVIDFLWYLQNDQGLHWRALKLYVAGLRYYYQELLLLQQYGALQELFLDRHFNNSNRILNICKMRTGILLLLA